jgi:hypothetical protein
LFFTDNTLVPKMKVLLSLPRGVADWLSSRSWLKVQQAEKASLQWGTWSVPLELSRVESSIDPEQLMRTLSPGRPGEPLPVVTGAYLRSEIRQALEDLGVGYIDRRGNIHLPWQGGVIHLELAVSSRDAYAQELARSLGGLGVHGVRAVQALLFTESDDVQVSHLAGVAELSLSRTHSVLRLLEEAGLVRVTGTGPSTRRHVVDKSNLLDWLAAQPSARRRERQLDVALYARTPHELWQIIRERLDRAHIAHGLTGSAAAAVFEAGPTSVVISGVRISPHFTLDDAARAMSAERTPRGANVRLMRDTGLLGSTQTIERDGVRIAPLVRVYLDTMNERRGEDIAQHFREVVLGY